MKCARREFLMRTAQKVCMCEVSTCVILLQWQFQGEGAEGIAPSS